MRAELRQLFDEVVGRLAGLRRRLEVTEERSVVNSRRVERELDQALQLWGYSFFLRPLSLVLITMIVALMGIALYRNLRPRRHHVHVGG